jgi:hypothetical protein
LHTLAVPAEGIASRRHDYAVRLHRADGGGRFEVWTSSERERLPRVRVPLLHPNPDVVLDLGAAFNAVYDLGRFDRRINYRNEPNPPLSESDAAWADALLREAGRR